MKGFGFFSISEIDKPFIFKIRLIPVDWAVYSFLGISAKSIVEKKKYTSRRLSRIKIPLFGT
ncbi:hypothetical protein DIM_01880 [Candidatus Denitrolinea symbiosum]|jgi:hypothetical protein|nr:hypothetical protein DIM_01880 [Candidatus Denitrolinea symbiosum]